MFQESIAFLYHIRNTNESYSEESNNCSSIKSSPVKQEKVRQEVNRFSNVNDHFYWMVVI